MFSKVEIAFYFFGYILVMIFPVVAYDMVWPKDRPLDMPSGGRGGDEDEEDAPEVIDFWGGQYEGDAFFWCLDKSCSMGWNGEIQQLKQEFSQTLNSLSSQAEFGVWRFQRDIFHGILHLRRLILQIKVRQPLGFKVFRRLDGHALDLPLSRRSISPINPTSR